ncbi:hypothetical protein ACIBVL_12195 [Streptomyces sp. NPDC049687]|uniref:hypothetical protein n=1 Tax=Streptomyces sp. NPDC049687 TaxID=3365596 RepID=UPI0037B275AA
MTTQESSRSGDFDQLVTAVADQLSRRLSHEEQAGYAQQPAREAELTPPSRRSGVYVRDNRPLPGPGGGQGAEELAAVGETGAVGTARGGPAVMPGLAPLGNGEPTAQQLTAGETTRQPETVPAAAASGDFEELRVDVDGPAPTMTVSGTVFRLLGGRLTWIAKVTKQPNGSYTGPIGYRDGNPVLRPGTAIRLRLTGTPPLQQMGAQVTFVRPDAPDEVVRYTHFTPHFRKVGIEFDRVAGAVQTDTYRLHDHPVRPPDLPDVTLSIEDAFTRQGIDVRRTGGGDEIPLSEAVNGIWSDIEMHDAMQRHWSEWKPGPGGEGVAQWQVWTLFAGQHDIGHDLGGIMFDDIGSAQRQGCAIFTDSFISDPPQNGDPAPEAFVRRMRFWTAVHEIGHTFNLAHSWEKALVPGASWVPLADEPDALSYMNYPFIFPNGGTQGFFRDFRYFFSEEELRFLRHAPERFVEQGNIPWFDHHGFQRARSAAAGGPLQLALRVSRQADAQGVYRFGMLEPVFAELKLTNVSTTPMMVDRDTLEGDEVSILVQRQGSSEARVVRPYLSYCRRPVPVLLQPGESLYAPVVLSSGLGGWQIDEPGEYRVYAALRTPSEGTAHSATAGGTGQILADPLPVRVLRPVSREHERLADDVYTDTVGRVLALGGSRVLDYANDVLRQTIERVPEEPVAKHAAACLATATAIPGKVLTRTAEGGARIEPRSTDVDGGLEMAQRAYGDLDAAADTFGHIRLTRRIEATAGALAEQDRHDPATNLLDRLTQTLRGRGVGPQYVQKVEKLKQRLTQDRGAR